MATMAISRASLRGQLPTPLPWKPQRGSVLSYEKARNQARIQIESRAAEQTLY